MKIRAEKGAVNMAKLPEVKCLHCGEMLPRDGTVEFIRVNNRYAHKDCVERLENEKALEQQVYVVAQKYLRETYSKTRVARSLTRMLAEGKTSLGIIKTLQYWYEVKKEDYLKANGSINIVDYVYDEAQEYYGNLESIQERNRAVDEEFFKSIETLTYYVRPQPIKRPKRVRMFDLK